MSGATERFLRTSENEEEWWQRAVIYEIAPISFQDSNSDGVGDLPGLIQRLDYVSWLGVDAVWLTPFYKSPMLDLGYDIADFCAIDPLFGTFEDFDTLLKALHARGIRLVIDFIPNHTSNQHGWFAESRASQGSPKRNWYVWAVPGPDGGPPNNWVSRFGCSAWQWDEKTGEYYYHAFLPEQPDLNWRNTDVRSAMADVLRFWLRRGVDGIRVDASAVLAEDPLLRDNPPDPEANEKTPPPQRFKPVFSDDRPESMKYLEELRRVIDEFPDRVLCGEVQGKIDRIGHFYGEQRPRLHLPLNFALLDPEWNALSLQAHIDAYLKVIPEKGWPDWVIGGHDKRRIATKIGQGQARVIAMLLMTLKGTAFFFAGDEIGMEQVEISSKSIRDPLERRVPGYGLSRDPQRVPMRWDSSENGGFTTGEPWLPMGPAVAGRNVAAHRAEPGSLLWLYRRLIRLRRDEPVLAGGEYVPMRSRHDVLMYKRSRADQHLLIALNMVHEPRKVDLTGDATVLLSTYLDRENSSVTGPFLLRPDEDLVIRLRR